jgi:hypothetical protein
VLAHQLLLIFNEYKKHFFAYKEGKTMMTGGIFPWLLVGLLLYFMLSRKGGMMGCCNGHDHNSSGHNNHTDHNSNHSSESHEDIIDLSKDDYRVRTRT